MKGDPTNIPAIRHILLDHLTIEGSRNAGIIHSLPDSPITDITLRDITRTAERGFDIKDATAPPSSASPAPSNPASALRKSRASTEFV